MLALIELFPGETDILLLFDLGDISQEYKFFKLLPFFVDIRLDYFDL